MQGKKTGGRKKGTPNKTTKVTRELLSNLAADMFPQIIEDLAKLEPEDRVRAWIKINEFCVSKPQSVSLDMEVQTKKTIEDKLRELSGEDDE